MLTTCGASDSFPYQDATGLACGIIENATRLILEKQVSEKVSCHQCGVILKDIDVRGHVGGHILRSLWGVGEDKLRQQVDSILPCGFCGHTSCSIDLLSLSARTLQSHSSCSRSHKFSYGPATKFSKNTPSTNVPLFCTLCPLNPSSKKHPVFWKYNMRHHIKDYHPHKWNSLLDEPSGLDPALSEKFSISPQEYSALGITRTPGALITNEIPQTRTTTTTKSKAKRKATSQPEAGPSKSKKCGS
ncbi:hypothetical protein JAAARDRAFT_198816 [Jaapia argillacea MUCL 33604]|uniref:Uncharacterized protein n=1 Tax=Jaapia argillacea MUCL 33604 TaxID=933084 RepID=A0A067PD16_9AGAM|nr:hypothetical protein JAAARDRAFT_198816 [Jaapia argillacea MUCL 33604]